MRGLVFNRRQNTSSFWVRFYKFKIVVQELLSYGHSRNMLQNIFPVATSL